MDYIDRDDIWWDGAIKAFICTFLLTLIISAIFFPPWIAIGTVTEIREKECIIRDGDDFNKFKITQFTKNSLQIGHTYKFIRNFNTLYIEEEIK